MKVIDKEAGLLLATPFCRGFGSSTRTLELAVEVIGRGGGCEEKEGRGFEESRKVHFGRLMVIWMSEVAVWVIVGCAWSLKWRARSDNDSVYNVHGSKKSLQNRVTNNRSLVHIMIPIIIFDGITIDVKIKLLLFECDWLCYRNG